MGLDHKIALDARRFEALTEKARYRDVIVHTVLHLEFKALLSASLEPRIYDVHGVLARSQYRALVDLALNKPRLEYL